MSKRLILNSCIVAALGLFGVGGPNTGIEVKNGRRRGIKLNWLGHAMFLIESSDGTRIVTDPYSAKTGYSVPKIAADIITISHRHHDHDNVGSIKGSPKVIESPGRFAIDSIIIEGISSYHDEVMGKKRGENTIFKFVLDQLIIAHMGDYGQSITEEQLAVLNGTDILLIPVGGTYTIDSEQAAEIIGMIKPKVVIPMHYKTEDCDIKIDPVEPFLQKMAIVKQKEDTIRLSALEVPDKTEVWVMNYSRQ